MNSVPPSAATYERELGRDLLASVSRSFYLSLRILPAVLRGPMSLAYLLARATDTVADTPGDRGVRLQTLQSLLACIDGHSDRRELSSALQTLHTPDAAERRLLDQVLPCLNWLDRVDPADRQDIRWVLSRITKGQIMDLTRFDQGVFGVKSAADLVEYTYLVAGCVGEFWTRMATRLLSRYAKVSVDQMLKDGAALGRGLQLVNILRDFPVDLKNGRCYLPMEELGGVSESELQANPALAKGVFEHWVGQARKELAAGFAYCDNVRIRRVRFATALPIFVGRRTLDLVQTKFPQPGVKISRGEMRACLCGAFSKFLF